MFLKVYRETPHSTTKVAPATLLFGFAHTSGIPQIDTMSLEKLKELHEYARRNDEEAKKRMKKDLDLRMKAREPQIKVGARVLLKVERKVNSDPTWDPTPYT
ncbi:Transposon Tf2-9 poly, partial [Brachionus plicatilis]